MATTIGGKKPATTKSGHRVVLPPQISKGPALTPAGVPMPTPYAITAGSHSAKGTSSRLTIAGAQVLTAASYMKVDPPGNMPSKATGGDLINASSGGIVKMLEGSMRVFAGGEGVACTGHMAMGQVPNERVNISQGVAPLIQSVGMTGGGSGSDGSGGGGSGGGKGRPANQAENAGNPGSSSSPKAADTTKCSDPVDVVSGHVVDEETDFTLPGAIPLNWTRHYNTARHLEGNTMLGRGGWALWCEQWLQPTSKGITLRDEEGRSIYFIHLEVGENTFHRRERLELLRTGEDRYQVYSLDTRLTRHFKVLPEEQAPEPPSQRIDRPKDEKHLMPHVRTPVDEGPRAMLVEISDDWENRIELHYGEQRLTRITDSAGRVLRMHYDEEGRLSRVEVWSGRPTADDDVAGDGAGSGNVDMYTNSDEASCQLHVDYGYDRRGCLASATDALGHAERYEYDAFARRTAVTFKTGQCFHYEYDDSEESLLQGGRPDGFCHHVWGTPLPAEHARGHREDGTGDIGEDEAPVALPLREGTLIRRPDEGDIVLADSNVPRVYLPHSTGMVAKESVFGDRWCIDRRIDHDGYVLREANGSGAANEYQYDKRGNLTRILDRANNETLLSYNERDCLVLRTDPDGNDTHYAYDGYHNLIEARFPDGRRYTLDYDERGHLCAIFGGKDADTRLYAFEYDAQHNLVRQTTARGAVTEYRFDALGRPVARRDALGRMSRVARDVLGRPLAITRPDGSTVGQEYDPLGNVTSTTDALGHTTKMVYGGTGVLLKLTEPNGQKWRFVYDSDEQLVRIHNPRGESYHIGYDWVGRVRSERFFDGDEQHYRYNAGGYLYSIEVSDGSVRERHIDPLGNVTAEYCEHGDIRMKRDGLGRIEQALIEDPRGTVHTRFERDGLGRVVAEHQGIGEAPVHTMRFGYDELGRRSRRDVIVHVGEGEPPKDFDFDAVPGILTPMPHEIAEEREKTRQANKERGDGFDYADGADVRTTRFAYDAFGAPSRVDHDGHVLTIERDALGREVRRTSARTPTEADKKRWWEKPGDAADALATLTLESRYDEADRLLHQQLLKPGADGAVERLANRSYQYDGNGRLNQVNDARWGVTQYRYNPMGRLLAAQRGGVTEVFDYDVGGYLRGILDSVDKLRGHNAWSIGRGNMLQQRSMPDGWLVNYENDDRGRRTKMVEHGKGGPKTTVYHWDHRDRLRDVALPDGSMARYMYDAFGRRVKKEIIPPEWRDLKEVFTKAGELGDEGLRASLPERDVTEFVWDGDVMCAELRMPGGPGAEKRAGYKATWTRVHVHGPGGLTPWLQQEGGEVFTVVCNHLGQPRELVDGRGRVAWAAAHSVWGTVAEVARDEGAAGAADGVESPWRLLGQYADAETGLCYTRYRYFDADTGRWLSRDPLGIAGGRDLLGFDGAPTVEVDPWGLACEKRDGHASGAPEPEVQRFIQRFEERYPGRLFDSGHYRKRADGEWIEIDFETDNAIIEIKGNRGHGLTRQTRERMDPSVNPGGKVVFAVADHKKGMGRHVRRGVEEQRGVGAGRDEIGDVLDVLEPK